MKCFDSDPNAVYKSFSILETFTKLLFTKIQTPIVKASQNIRNN